MVSGVPTENLLSAILEALAEPTVSYIGLGYDSTVPLTTGQLDHSLCLPVNHILSLLPLVSQTTLSASQSTITFLCLAPPTKRNDSPVNYVLNPSFSSI